jgi:predicted ester cyclase
VQKGQRQYRGHGRHSSGEYLGIPPTGNKVNVTNTGIFRLKNGRLAETWMTADVLRLMQQLGAIPKQ